MTLSSLEELPQSRCDCFGDSSVRTGTIFSVNLFGLLLKFHKYFSYSKPCCIVDLIWHSSPTSIIPQLTSIIFFKPLLTLWVCAKCWIPSSHSALSGMYNISKCLLVVSASAKLSALCELRPHPCSHNVLIVSVVLFFSCLENVPKGACVVSCSDRRLLLFRSRYSQSWEVLKDDGFHDNW